MTTTAAAAATAVNSLNQSWIQRAVIPWYLHLRSAAREALLEQVAYGRLHPPRDAPRATRLLKPGGNLLSGTVQAPRPHHAGYGPVGSTGSTGSGSTGPAPPKCIGGGKGRLRIWPGSTWIQT